MVQESPIIEVNQGFDPNVFTHSIVESGRFGAEVIYNPSWAALARKALLHFFNFAKPIDRSELVKSLGEITGFIISTTEFERAQRVPGTPLWYQGQDARDIWRAAQWIAHLLGVDVELTVRWKVHPDAAYPGESRLVRYEPAKYWQ